MAAIMQQLQAWVSASGILADKMAVIMIIALFGLMVVGLVLGQELAFVLGGAGVIIGWLAWGGPGVTIAMTKIYDQMQSYSMVAIPMFVLMANFLTHSKVADGLFESIRYPALCDMVGYLHGRAVWVWPSFWFPLCSPPPPVSWAHPWSPWVCCPCLCCFAAATSPLWPAAWCAPAVLWVF